MTGPRRNGIQFSILALLIASLGFVVWRSANALDELRRTRDRLADEVSSSRSRESAALTEQQSAAAMIRDRERGRAFQATALSAETIAEAMEQKIAEMKTSLASAPPPPRLPPLPAGATGNVFFPELFGDPVYRALAGKFMEVEVEATLGPFLSKLSGSPDKRERVRMLLIDQAVGGVFGLDQGGAWETENRKIGAEINAILGEEANALMRSRMASDRRKLVARFAERLSYSAQPLSRDQQNHLVELMMNAVDPKTGRNFPARTFTRAIVEQAQDALSPAQVEALRKFAGMK